MKYILIVCLQLIVLTGYCSESDSLVFQYQGESDKPMPTIVFVNEKSVKTHIPFYRIYQLDQAIFQSLIDSISNYKVSPCGKEAEVLYCVTIWHNRKKSKSALICRRQELGILLREVIDLLRAHNLVEAVEEINTVITRLQL